MWGGGGSSEDRKSTVMPKGDHGREDDCELQARKLNSSILSCKDREKRANPNCHQSVNSSWLPVTNLSNKAF